MRDGLPPLQARRVSVFPNALDTKPFDHLPLEKVLQYVREGKYLPAIRRIRSTEDKDRRQELKKKTCPATSFSGQFKRRRDAALIQHSGVIRLDFDGLEDKAAEKERLKQDPCVLALFDSVSGELSDGLSVLVPVYPVPTSKAEHKQAFAKLEERYGLEGFDEIVKSPSWLTYFSYDPDLHVNWKAKSVEVEYQAAPARQPSGFRPGATEDEVGPVIEDGTKYSTLLYLAGLMRSKGFHRDVIRTACHAVHEEHGETPGAPSNIDRMAEDIGTKPFDVEESASTFIGNVLSNGATEEEAQGQNDKNDRNATPQNSGVAEDPDFFPPRLYELLPETLRKVTEVLETDRERAVFLAGALPVLAGAAPNVLLRYGQQWQALNLYFLIVAPAGAGKAPFRHARRMGDKMQDRLIRESKKALSNWKARRESEDSDAGPRPPLRSFYLAGDNSAAGLKEELAANPHGVIFETEIKTVTTALTQEWGQYRDVLLKSAHNEPLTKKRKGEEPIHIGRPALSVGLTGTPRSVEEIIIDAEDGLFSRCFFLAFDGGTDFRDMFEGDRDDALDAALSEAAERLDNLREALEKRDKPLYVKIGPQEQRRIVEAGRYATAQVMRSKVGRHFLSNVRRAALSAFRIAALLRLLRLFEQEKPLTSVRSVEVSPSDVEAGLTVALTCLEHAAFLSGKLQNRDRLKGLKGEKRAFFKALPAGTFTTAKAKAVAASFSFSERSAERYLKAYVERGLLSDVKHGTWRKPKFAPVSFLSFLSFSRSDFDQNDKNKDATPQKSAPRHSASTFSGNGHSGSEGK